MALFYRVQQAAVHPGFQRKCFLGEIARHAKLANIASDSHPAAFPFSYPRGVVLTGTRRHPSSSRVNPIQVCTTSATLPRW